MLNMQQHKMIAGLGPGHGQRGVLATKRFLLMLVGGAPTMSTSKKQVKHIKANLNIGKNIGKNTSLTNDANK